MLTLPVIVGSPLAKVKIIITVGPIFVGKPNFLNVNEAALLEMVKPVVAAELKCE